MHVGGWVKSPFGDKNCLNKMSLVRHSEQILWTNYALYKHFRPCLWTCGYCYV